jgi:type II secretory pathway component PulF
MTADDLTSLNEQIAAMARAGLPLDQGLESLAREMGRGKLRTVTDALANDLRAGHPLPEALARQQGQIPPYYSNLVTAGVQTGRLPEVLTTLTTYARSVAATRSTVIEALLYPAIVLVVGITLFCALSFYLLPQFDQIFQDFGLKTPYITQLAMEISRNGDIVLIVFALLTGFVALAVSIAQLTTRGRELWARLVYRVPLVGIVIRSARLAAFCDLLGMLVEYGVPLPTAFRLAGSASSDPIMAAKACDVEEQLNQGVPLAAAFVGRGLAPDWVVWLAAAGERRNELAVALREIATIYRRQVDTRSAILRSVLAPFVVITTAGAITVFFATIVMVPMISLLESLSK